MTKVSISLAQMHIELAQPDANLEQAISFIKEASNNGSDVILFPELWSSGYDLKNAEWYVQVNDSIRYICGHLGLTPRLEYSGGDRGWIGDNPFIFLDCSRIRALGWRPKLTIREAIVRTVQFLAQNPWLLERR